MKKHLVATALLTTFFTACNIYEFMDTPSGDAQVLAKARACFDEGDFNCARDYYGKLSSAQNDVRLMEDTLAGLAQDGLFLMSDFISSLGSGNGSGASITTMVNTLAARGKTATSLRESLRQKYNQASAITQTDLRAFTQFIVAYTLFSQVLAQVAGVDAVLSGNDLALVGNSCKTLSGAACATTPNDCDAPTGIGVDMSSNNATLSSSSGWDDDANIAHVTETVSAMSSAISALTNSQSGIFNAISVLNTDIGIAGENCKRQVLIQALFP